MTEQTPAELHVAGQLPVYFRETLLPRIEEKTSFQVMEDLRGAPRRMEIGVGGKFQFHQVPLQLVEAPERLIADFSLDFVVEEVSGQAIGIDLQV